MSCNYALFSYLVNYSGFYCKLFGISLLLWALNSSFFMFISFSITYLIKSPVLIFSLSFECSSCNATVNSLTFFIYSWSLDFSNWISFSISFKTCRLSTISFSSWFLDAVMEVSFSSFSLTSRVRICLYFRSLANSYSISSLLSASTGPYSSIVFFPTFSCRSNWVPLPSSPLLFLFMKFLIAAW